MPKHPGDINRAQGQQGHQIRSQVRRRLLQSVRRQARQSLERMTPAVKPPFVGKYRIVAPITV